MKRLLNIIPISTTVLLLYSCEGYRMAEGIVKDKLANTPLDSVLCTVTSGTESMYTDSSGSFNLHNKFGSCMFGCKSIVVAFSKPGYKTISVTNPDVPTVIYLER